MTISIIAVLDTNNAIGKNNKLLCYLPADLKHFKKLTTGHTIVMGRKTYESLPNGALPNRKNVVLTKNTAFKCKGCDVVNSVEEVLDICREDENVFIIGGAQIYKLFIEKADRLYLTHVHNEFKADTYFPDYETNKWSAAKIEDFEPDGKNKFSYSFAKYVRKRNECNL
ncbi:MAG: hypothetical protein B6I20_05085 [Bacteroidetes bacterium 4572_117]|nr:MAG: hypothetical protein B6I20_05085 [Bacteroidetes bacterium 4572_117]